MRALLLAGLAFLFPTLGTAAAVPQRPDSSAGAADAVRPAALPPDSIYATPALRRLVAEVAQRNRRAPAAFGSYRARLETEIALIARDSLGREQALEIEQLETRATWRREGTYDLRVLGYRAQNRGVPYSALNLLQGYTVPWLYGDRLNLGTVEPRRKRKTPRTRQDTLTFIHPFAADRDRYYRFAGGDTVANIRVDEREIPVVRVVVRPQAAASGRFGAFEGDIDVDAQRGHIVRMRGQFVRVSRAGSGALTRAPGLVAVAYVDFTNAEVDRRYWLPASQRTEFQATFAPLGNVRAVFRVVSSFGGYELSDTTVAPDTTAAGPAAPDTTVPDTATVPPLRVSFSYAPRDSMDAFDAWRTGLGEATAGVHADDFADLAPDSWRPDGRPRLDPMPHSMSEIFRFNRVEGLYLGAAGTARFRDAFPGLEAGAFGGYAMAERTFRGGVRASLRRLPWTISAGAERTLVSSNDFTLPLAEDPGFTALLSSVDDYDYADRRLAKLSFTRVLGSVETALVRAEAGVGRDRNEQQRIERGLFGSRTTRFLPNRGALDGTYARFSADLELHPAVSGDFLQPGAGARLHLEQGVGQLAWRRAELSLSARKYWGPLSLGAHADAGLVAGTVIPPQQLFELGGRASIPGYAFKEFAGDRAALLRAAATYRLGVLTRPMHAVGRLYLPGLAPALAVSAQGGWTELSSAAARLAAQRLGPAALPAIVRPTGGTRGSVAVGTTFLSDLLHVAAARPVDHAARWRLLVGFGPVF